MKISLCKATSDNFEQGIRAEIQFAGDENVVGGPLKYELDFMPFRDFAEGDFREFQTQFESMAQYNGVEFESCDCVEEYRKS